MNQFASEEWPLRAGLMRCPAYYSHLICDSSHPHYCPQCTMLGLARGRVIYYLEAKIINYKLSGHKNCTIKVKMCINIYANRAHSMTVLQYLLPGDHGDLVPCSPLPHGPRLVPRLLRFIIPPDGAVVPTVNTSYDIENRTFKFSWWKEPISAFKFKTLCLTGINPW